jgi:hypothetical protein
MTPKSNTLPTLSNPPATPEPCDAKPLVEPSAKVLTLEEWTQNGINRLNDQVTPFPKVF